MPYGLGQHPFFPRPAGTRLTTQVQGVWLSRPDCLPTQHTTQFPPSWDPRGGMDVHGTLIDNAYTGWSGEAGAAALSLFFGWMMARTRLSRPGVTLPPGPLVTE